MDSNKVRLAAVEQELKTAQEWFSDQQRIVMSQRETISNLQQNHTAQTEAFEALKAAYKRMVDQLAASGSEVVKLRDALAYANSVKVTNETPRHNARRLAWRTYVCALRSNDIEWRMAAADDLVAAEEQRFGEIK
jgi:predicted  nucleic acid-binding Zn-ribbon protein